MVRREMFHEAAIGSRRLGVLDGVSLDDELLDIQGDQLRVARHWHEHEGHGYSLALIIFRAGVNRCVHRSFPGTIRADITTIEVDGKKALSRDAAIICLAPFDHGL